MSSLFPRPDRIHDRVAEETMSEACRLFSTVSLTVHVRDLRSRLKMPEVVGAKKACCKVLYDYLPNYSRVGVWLHKNHCSVRHARFMAEKSAQEDPDFAAKLRELAAYLRQRDRELRRREKKQSEEASARAAAEWARLAQSLGAA